MWLRGTGAYSKTVTWTHTLPKVATDRAPTHSAAPGTTLGLKSTATSGLPSPGHQRATTRMVTVTVFLRPLSPCDLVQAESQLAACATPFCPSPLRHKHHGAKWVPNIRCSDHLGCVTAQEGPCHRGAVYALCGEVGAGSMCHASESREIRLV
jgi:hypothetical protein